MLRVHVVGIVNPAAPADGASAPAAVERCSHAVAVRTRRVTQNRVSLNTGLSPQPIAAFTSFCAPLRPYGMYDRM